MGIPIEINRQTMQIFVRQVNGSLSTLAVSDDQTVANVRATVSEQNGVSVDELRLSANGLELADETVLASCLSDNATLEAMLRIRGGGKKRKKKNYLKPKRVAHTQECPLGHPQVLQDRQPGQDHAPEAGVQAPHVRARCVHGQPLRPSLLRQVLRHFPVRPSQRISNAFTDTSNRMESRLLPSRLPVLFGNNNLTSLPNQK